MPCGLFPKTTFDGVILFQSTVLPSAPLETTGGRIKSPSHEISGHPCGFSAVENIDSNQNSAAVETSPLIELGKVNPDSGLCTL